MPMKKLNASWVIATALSLFFMHGNAWAQSAIRLPISATAFAGVDPSGSSDSTSGLATALAAAAGGELDIPAGTYLISAFVPAANTVVKGSGVSITTLKRLGSATSSTSTPLVTVPSGGSIDSLTIDLNSPKYGNLWSGVGPNGSTINSSLRHISIQNPGFNGLQWDNNLGNWTHVGTQLDDIKITGSSWVGAIIKGINNGSASNIVVTSSGWNAIEIDYDSNFQLISARADKSNPPPLFYAGPGNPLVTTSNSSNTLANTGNFAFTVGSGLNYNIGQEVCAYYRVPRKIGLSRPLKIRFNDFVRPRECVDEPAWIF